MKTTRRSFMGAIAALAAAPAAAFAKPKWSPHREYLDSEALMLARIRKAQLAANPPIYIRHDCDLPITHGEPVYVEVTYGKSIASTVLEEQRELNRLMKRMLECPPRA